MPEPGTQIRIWIAVAVVIGAIAISLMGVVNHLKTSESFPAEDGESKLFEKYRYLFRTEKEHEAFVAANTFSTINHGCCKSIQTFEKPDEAFTEDDTQVTVVQDEIIGDTEVNQYFTVDTCTQLPGPCRFDCTCQLNYGHYPAYVEYPNGTRKISRIRVESCCKCVNRHL